jgi:hypothetical protein
MQQQFSLTASPTGFNAENVTLDGYFEYNWDANHEKLIDHKVVVTNMSPDRISSGSSVRFLFTNKTFDRSQVKQYEGPFFGNLGYRDELYLIAAIFVTYLSSSGATVTQELATKEVKQSGNRYYETIATPAHFA